MATFPNCPITEIARLGPTLRQWKDTYLGYVTTDGANSGSTDAVGAGVDQVVRVDAEHAAGGSKGVDVVGLALTCPGGAAGRLNLPHVLTPLDPLACSASRSSRGTRGSATGAPRPAAAASSNAASTGSKNWRGIAMRSDKAACSTMPKMSYPLVRDLAVDGVPVAVTCRVLKLARQPYYRWLAAPITARELDEAYLANVLFDAHHDDPEFGHRLLADEAARAGLGACDRRVWRICRDNRWWSVFGKKRAKNGKKPGPPAHEDLVLGDFSATAPNELWLTDITEQPTSEGKLYLCAVKDVFSNRIVGYSISDRMKSQIAVDAVASAVQRRGIDVTGCVVHSDRGSIHVRGRQRTTRRGRHPPVDGSCRLVV